MTLTEEAMSRLTAKAIDEHADISKIVVEKFKRFSDATRNNPAGDKTSRALQELALAVECLEETVNEMLNPPERS